jgi:hypothetical protein
MAASSTASPTASPTTEPTSLTCTPGSACGSDVCGPNAACDASTNTCIAGGFAETGQLCVYFECKGGLSCNYNSNGYYTCNSFCPPTNKSTGPSPTKSPSKPTTLSPTRHPTPATLAPTEKIKKKGRKSGKQPPVLSSTAPSGKHSK